MVKPRPTSHPPRFHRHHGRRRRRLAADFVRPRLRPVDEKKSTLNNLNVALIGFGAEGAVLPESLLNIDGIQLVAIVDIWEYTRNKGQRQLKARRRGRSRLRKLRRPARAGKRFAGRRRRHAGFLARAHHQRLPEGGTARLLRKDDEQHHRRRAFDGADDARDRKTVADRPPAPQQSALHFCAKPAFGRREALRPAYRRQRAMEPRRGRGFGLAEKIAT